MATIHPPGVLFPKASSMQEVLVPVPLLIQLMEAVGGKWTMDRHDLLMEPDRSVRVEVQIDPWMYVITLEDK